MRDPDEGVDAAGRIVTGVRRDRISPTFAPVLAAAVDALVDRPGVSVYAYGSVVTGQAVVGRSDVDLISYGVAAERAAAVGAELSRRFADRCRGVEIGAGQATDLAGSGDEAYGNRVFLRHHCVHLAGPDLAAGLPRYPADARAARGFNGDLGAHLDRWRTAARTPELGRRVARKTLLAVAGLVSVHDRTWTTDRASAAVRWGQIEPGLAAGLRQLASWCDEVPYDAVDVETALGVAAAVWDRFEQRIGGWR